MAACAWLATTLIAATPSPSPQSAAPQSPAKTADDPGAALMTRLCSDCHEATRVTEMRRTRPDWEDVINKMIEKGATGSDKEFEAVFGYLVRTYGKVFINTAKADEIAAVLSLSPKDAQAIVEFRTANGKFADLDAIKKVPGIDVKKLDEHKDAVAF
jgi:competence ComEA-like helix-hairpin-helix protein